MRSQHIAMSYDDFDLLPAHPGWKQEYWDGMAHITPRAQFAVMRMDVEPRAVHSSLGLRALDGADRSALASAYVEAFADTVEYCDWEEEAIDRSAREIVREFLAASRGEALPASRVAVEPAALDPAEGIAGAALLTRTADGRPMLDMLLVRPRWQRLGLATALVARSLGELHRHGETLLRSRCLLANEPSRAWHRKFGFIEEPDLLLARLYLRCARQELRRKEKREHLSEEDRRRLQVEVETWESRVEELERVADKEGIEAVSPALQLW